MASEERQRRGNGPTDAQADLFLLRLIRRGDETALEAVYVRYGGLLYGLALRIVRDREVAREVVQDTFLRLWSRSGEYDPARGRVATWLSGISRNLAVDALRARLSQARLIGPADVATPRFETAPDVTGRGQGDAPLLAATVSTAFRVLPPAQRQVLELAYVGGFTQAEISRLLAEPLGTIKSRIRSALEQLRSTLASVSSEDRCGQGHKPTSTSNGARRPAGKRRLGGPTSDER